MVWLGVDLGNARVGLGQARPERKFGPPAWGGPVNRGSVFALDAVIGVIEDENVDHVVVGLPLQMDGTEGRSAKKARRWADNLKKRMSALLDDGQFALTAIPAVTLVDERLTTVSAHRLLHDARIGGRQHRPVVDQQAAVVILQTALDSRENR